MSEFYSATFKSPLGEIYLVSDEEALRGAWIEGQTNYKEGLIFPPHKRRIVPPLEQAREWLRCYFAKIDGAERPKLRPLCTPARRNILEQVCRIPYGSTASYGDICKQLHARGIMASPRSVGNAVAHNPMIIFIPCHRVLGTNGSLTGYAGGLERKRFLLSLEGSFLPFDVANARSRSKK